MPLVYQHNINDNTKLRVWHIREDEDFFLAKVPAGRNITHLHKRLQHLAGRYLLQEMFSDFPYELLEIADTRKPFLTNEAYHFSISHCGDYAAAVVSKTERVGIDLEVYTARVLKVKHKFLHPSELAFLNDDIKLLTLCWSVKEAMFKWYSHGEIDFREHLKMQEFEFGDQGEINAAVTKNSESTLVVNYKMMGQFALAWTRGNER